MFKLFFSYLKEWKNNLWQLFKLRFKSNAEKDLEIIALRSQLALLNNKIESKKIPKPNSTLAFRQLWVLISSLSSNWKSYLISFKPATIIGWHKTAFKFYWRRKSNKGGRPPICDETKDIIEKIVKENPLLSPEKIHEQLALLGLENPPAPNTIAKYFPSTRKPPNEKQVQSWLTFLQNTIDSTWATDFFTVPTLTFNVLYVLIIINHGNREIVHFAVTKNPNMFWLRQQFRNATPYNKKVKYLIHDNDPVFKSKIFQEFLSSSNIKSKATSIRSPWQNPYAERVIGSIRRELLDHIIPLNENHLERLLNEYINDYYNSNRTHQGINCKTPINKPKYIPTAAKNFKIKSKPVLNGLYHTYERAS